MESDFFLGIYKILNTHVQSFTNHVSKKVKIISLLPPTYGCNMILDEKETLCERDQISCLRHCRQVPVDQ